MSPGRGSETGTSAPETGLWITLPLTVFTDTIYLEDDEWSGIITALVGSIANVLVGALIAAVANFLAIRWQARSNLLALELQLAAQLEIAKATAASQLEQERERHRRERVEDAHSELMRWCHGLEQVIDDVWSGITSESQAEKIQTRGVLDEWPWETLREPEVAAMMSHYWSEATREKLSRFSRESSRFVSCALLVLDLSSDGRRPDQGARREWLQRVWESRGKLLGILENVRRGVHAELAG